MATKKTFGQAFKTARNIFKKSGSAADYTFKYGGKLYNILQKGETKKGVMEKFGSGASPAKDKRGVTRSLRPKLRPKPKKIIKDTSRDPEYAPGNFGSRKKPLITVTILEPAKTSEGDPEIAELQRRVKSARSAAEVREIVEESGIKISAAKMTVLLDELEKAGLFNFKPAKPKPSPRVENVEKPNRTITKSKKMSNAADIKRFKERYPSRLAKIKIGDIVYFDPNRTNLQDNPAIVMINSKGK